VLILHTVNKDDLAVKSMSENTDSKEKKWSVVRVYKGNFDCEEAIRRVIEAHEDSEGVE